jgi:hypothetical protein
MSNLLLKLGVKSHAAEVEVYRDGEVVTLIAKGNAVRETENGQVKTTGVVVQQYQTVAAFEADREKLFKRFPLAYTKIVHKLGISDDVKNASPLPDNMRHLLPEYSKALPQKSDVTITVEGEISTKDDVSVDDEPRWYNKFV